MSKDGEISQAVVGMVDPNLNGIQKGFPQLQPSDPSSRVSLGKLKLNPEEKAIGATAFGRPHTEEEHGGEYGVRVTVLTPHGEVFLTEVGMIDPNRRSGIHKGYPRLQSAHSETRIRMGSFAVQVVPHGSDGTTSCPRKLVK